MANHKKRFWKQFLVSRKEIGSVTPSSKYLKKGIIDKINFSTAKVIVEFGPGTGVFTEALIEKMAPDTHLIVIELNRDMFLLLKERFNHDRVHILNESAENLSEILARHGFHQADVIVSSLPFSVMPQEITEKILEAASSCLSKSGQYIQFMYSLVLKKKLSSFFEKKSIKYVFLNFPPAFVLEFSSKQNEH